MSQIDSSLQSLSLASAITKYLEAQGIHASLQHESAETIYWQFSVLSLDGWISLYKIENDIHLSANFNIGILRPSLTNLIAAELLEKNSSLDHGFYYATSLSSKLVTVGFITRACWVSPLKIADQLQNLLILAVESRRQWVESKIVDPLPTQGFATGDK